MTIEPNEKYTYFLYARKSSESEDRQVQSIEDQMSRLQELASALNLRIKEVFTEAKSAKKPNNRPIFSEMLSRIEKGEADGILCWQINRLSRNPIDSGTISWMLQQGVLKCIQTIDKKYLPDDNVLLFNVESGMANQFIIDLRKNCRRGMEGKAERGWKPSLPPLGYLNDKLERTIIPDKDRFDLVRKMWDMMISGNYTPPQIRKIANEKWGFRTQKHKSFGDKELSNSVMYKMFSNIFYTGMFEWARKLYNGNHKSMITVQEFDRVQVMLGRKGKPRPKSHEFAYTGLMHCGFCGSMYTATEKTKMIKMTGHLKSYTYYHCTKKKPGIKCTSAKPLTVENLEMQIEMELEKYTILQRFLEWGLETLEGENKKEVDDKTKIHRMCQTSLQEAEKELENLTRMRYKELIDDITFVKERDLLKASITKLKHQLQEPGNRQGNYIELTKQALHFATYARKSLVNGAIHERREILSAFGSNCHISEKIFFIEASEWLIPIGNDYPELEEEFMRIELNKMLTPQGRNDALASICQRWCATVQDVRTAFENLGDITIKIPMFTSHQLPRPP